MPMTFIVKILDYLEVLLTSWPFIVLLIFLFVKEYIIQILQKILKGLSIKDNKLNFNNTEQDINNYPETIQLGNTSQPLEETKNNKAKTQISLDKIKPTTSDIRLKKQTKEYKLPELPESGLKNYMLDMEEYLKQELLQSPYKKLDIMIRDSANYRIATEFERIYRIIFGSQMRFLRHLDIVKKISNKDAIKFFKQEKKKVSNNDLEYDAWIRFLISQKLIEYKDDTYTITNKGLAFITYVATFNYEDRIL